jgi:hypothetical protein
MTKIDGRDNRTAARQLDESLRRLQTDHLDLLQFHEVIRTTDPARIFGPGGGIEAALAAKQAGKIRYIGFTGHKSPAMHLQMLETGFSHQFNFDAVQMPLNVMDAHYDSFEKKVLPVLLKHKIGVLGMKPMGDHIILESKTASAVECLHYALSLPTSVVITGCDSLPILHRPLELLAVSSRRVKNRLPPCWRGLPMLRRLVCMNATKRVTISMGPITIHSGWGQRLPMNKKNYVNFKDFHSFVGV